MSMNKEKLKGMEEGANNEKKSSKVVKWWLLILSCIFLSIGQVGGPLLFRLYYLHGGQRKWFTSWLQTVAFPLLLIPISISYARARARHESVSIFSITRNMIIASAFIGFLFALDSYLYAYGLSYLPVSTSSLLISTQTAFTAAFAFLIVKQKFTFYSINSVVLLTLGSIVLGIHASRDRPPNVSNEQYFLGFFMTLGAAAVFGLSLPSIEISYSKVCKAITFHLVLQMQFLICVFSTLFCTFAMIINKDFQVIGREAREYGLGEAKYCVVVILSAIAMQLMIIGNMGVIFCSTSLFSGIFTALLLPVQQTFAVIFFHEKFTAEKGMALALCLWGFASYFYGEYKKTPKKATMSITESEQPNGV